MEVQIMSRETIKPSSPTPNHQKFYKLCFLDQLAPCFYIPMILFYSASNENLRTNISHHLKKSLSKTLTHFYPFAGRIKDDLTIDCKDNGVTFIEAKVALDMSFVLQDPKFDILQQLLPCNPFQHLPRTHPSSKDQVLLAVQVNYFACHGLAIAICVSHLISDASAAASFLKAWAGLASDSANDITFGDVIYDCSSLFPPQDLSALNRVDRGMDESNKVIVTKRFLFDGSKISTLKKEIRDGLGLLNLNLHPTRFEVVAALIWEALIATSDEDDETSQILRASISVNMRNRINPPLPQQCISSVSYVTISSLHTVDERIKNRSNLARKLHESIKEIDDEYIRKMYTGGECFKSFMEKAVEEFSSKIGIFFFSSWCRYPFYDIDFGWGQPTWFATALRINRFCCFLDSSDGEGIEAWISLTKEEMDKLEQQHGILAYATFKSNIS